MGRGRFGPQVVLSDTSSPQPGCLASPPHTRQRRRRSMAVELARNPWGIVSQQQEGILELRWLPSTAEMTDDDFKATLELFAEQAERAGPPFLLIDATDFQHRFGEGVMAWRDRQINPRYNAS